VNREDWIRIKERRRFALVLGFIFVFLALYAATIDNSFVLFFMSHASGLCFGYASLPDKLQKEYEKQMKERW
jgi:hypothetical protein